MTDVCLSACLYPPDGSVLSAYAVMFWDDAGKTVSSTAMLCDSEALGILGFTYSKSINQYKNVNTRAK